MLNKALMIIFKNDALVFQGKLPIMVPTKATPYCWLTDDAPCPVWFGHYLLIKSAIRKTREF